MHEIPRNNALIRRTELTGGTRGLPRGGGERRFKHQLQSKGELIVINPQTWLSLSLLPLCHLETILFTLALPQMHVPRLSGSCINATFLHSGTSANHISLFIPPSLFSSQSCTHTYTLSNTLSHILMLCSALKDQ